MSAPASGASWFNITIYGQDRMVMDWFNLADPFQENLPIQFANGWSGTLYFQGQLVNPPAWYSNYSGIGLGSAAGGGTGTAVMTWLNSISGQIDKSGVTTDNLTLKVIAYTSGNYTGALNSVSVPLTNVLFSRYSGVIKVFGDQYSFDVPVPSYTQLTGGGFVSGQIIEYAMSYILSGWESDPQTVTSVTIASGYGGVRLDWTGVAGVGQYAIYRASGGAGAPGFSTTSGTFTGTNAPDFLALVSGGNTTYTDSGQGVTLSGLWRAGLFVGYPNWVDMLGSNITFAKDTGTYLSPPASMKATGQGGSVSPPSIYQMAQVLWLKKNLSGTTLLGPFYWIVHWNAGGGETPVGWELQQGIYASLSGNNLYAQGNVPSAGGWNRQCFYISGLNSSGYSAFQIYKTGRNNPPGPSTYFDDVFLVAQS